MFFFLLLGVPRLVKGHFVFLSQRTLQAKQVSVLAVCVLRIHIIVQEVFLLARSSSLKLKVVLYDKELLLLHQVEVNQLLLLLHKVGAILFVKGYTNTYDAAGLRVKHEVEPVLLVLVSPQLARQFDFSHGIVENFT